MNRLEILFVCIAAAVVIAGSAESADETAGTPGATTVHIDIWTAAARGDTQAIEEHIAAGTDLNAREPARGGSPLGLQTSEWISVEWGRCLNCDTPHLRGAFWRTVGLLKGIAFATHVALSGRLLPFLEVRGNLEA